MQAFGTLFFSSIPFPLRRESLFASILLPFGRKSLVAFDSAPLGAESGIVSDTRSSGLASPRQRRQMFVSASLHYLAMPLSSGSLAPFVNVVGFNTQLRCGALRHQIHQSATSKEGAKEESASKQFLARERQAKRPPAKTAPSNVKS